jgi:hypothetical protein
MSTLSRVARASFTLGVRSRARRRSIGTRELPVPELPRRVAERVVVPRAHDELRITPRAPAPTTVRTRRLRRVAGWLSALPSHDAVSARFFAERQRDEGLVRRVERRRRR